MKRKSLAVLLMTALLAGSAFADNAPELTVAFFTFGSPMGDLQLVQDEINKVALPKIGATVKLVPLNIGAWSQQINLMLASGENLDLIVTGTGTLGFNSQVARNQLLPLDDLIAKNGAGIKAAMAPEFLAAAKIKGKIYAVPSVRDFAADFGVDIRQSLVDKYKIDLKAIKTYDDLEKVLLMIKQKEPQLTPIYPGTAGNSMVTWMTTWDSLGDNFGVLMDYGKTLKVVNLYEQPEYVNLVKMLRRWYQEGLILKDASTNKDNWEVMVKADKLASIITSRKPGIDAQVTKEAGQPMVTVGILPARSTTSNVANIMWGVPRNSKNPDKAVAFLNLMYSDAAVINLFDWGVEGKHYVKTADGLIDYPAGVTAGNTGWGLAQGWLFGNQLKSYVWKGDSPTLYKDLEAFNNGALKSKALGFTFDPTPVKTEYAAVSNVFNQYWLGLENGMLDPESTLKTYNQKLKAAGLDKIIAEKQKQLDAWAAN